MSLEETIAANTLAIQELTSLLKSTALRQVENITPPAPVTPAIVKTVEPVKAPEKVVDTTHSEPAPKSEVSYQDVVRAVTDLAGYANQAGERVGRTAALKVLAQYGIRNASELKPEQYAGVVKVLEVEYNHLTAQ